LAAQDPSATGRLFEVENGTRHVGSPVRDHARPGSRSACDVADLAVVIVSANDARWLERCLSSLLAHAGTASLDLLVVDNASTDGTRELVAARFPAVRLISSPNRGFAYGNNRGIESTSARYVLLLNPDTEVVDGTLGELVDALDDRRDVGLAGVRQHTSDGALYPTIRRFPSAARALGEALFAERWWATRSWAGERVLDRDIYEREHDCDWMSGSFMLVRREALISAGVLDERFFLYYEEPDLCLRIKRAGWRVRYLPSMTILHHANKSGVHPKLAAQDAFARRQYARKHFTPAHRALYLGAVALRHALRVAGASITEPFGSPRIKAERWALRVTLGSAAPPFRAPPRTAVSTGAAELSRVVKISDAPRPAPSLRGRSEAPDTVPN
jgi:GT2 family glycosyltransferase